MLKLYIAILRYSCHKSCFPHAASVRSLCAVASGVDLDAVRRDVRRIEEQIARLEHERDQLISSATLKQVRPPRGMYDHSSSFLTQRDKVLRVCESVARLAGASRLETPTVEHESVLTGVNTSPLYTVRAQRTPEGREERLALRYDLTVPFARFLAQRRLRSHFKRYSYGPVYRLDTPNIEHGRMREFYQFDYDIATAVDDGSGLAEAECIAVSARILSQIVPGQFSVRLNHRALVRAILLSAEIDDALHDRVLTVLDKCDKIGWENVCKELSVDLLASQIDALQACLRDRDLINLQRDEKLMQDSDCRTAISVLQRITSHLDCLLPVNLRFDPLLVRGLAYYTGAIFECTLDDNTVGSIGGGGRYDDLVSDISRHDGAKCVGLSLGVDRILAALGHKATRRTVDSVIDQAHVVSVLSAHRGLDRERLKLMAELWNAGVAAEIPLHRSDPKLLTQLQAAEQTKTKYAVLIGDEEIQNGTVRLRCISDRSDVVLLREQVPAELKTRLAGTN